MDDPQISLRPEPPPLRIHHLMACAVVAAMELSLMRFLWGLSHQQQSAIGSGVYGFYQVLNSVGLTLTGFSIYWWRKGYASFSHPGQMLLIQYACTLVMQLTSALFVSIMFGRDGTPRDASWMTIVPLLMAGASLLFGILLPMAFYAWCAWKIADSWPWRLLFIICALTTVLTSTVSIILVQMFRSISPSDIQTVVGLPYLIRGGLLFAVGLLAALGDRLAERDRSWTHWVGIVLWLLGQIGAQLMGLYYLFFWKVS